MKGMLGMVYVLLTDGFEEMEAVAPVDLLRRAGAKVVTVGIGGKTVTGSHGIPVVCDVTEESAALDSSLRMLVLPGGPGTEKLRQSAFADRAIRFAFERGLLIGAICAAPSLLGRRGLLRGLRATSYPSYLDDSPGVIAVNEPVVRDGNIITARGPGAATDFALCLVDALFGADKAQSVGKVILKT